MRLDFTRYGNIVILTGAGVSAGSGLRTYRGPGGVWEEHNVEEYGHIRTLLERPEKTWQLFGVLRATLRAAEPNAAHLALAQLEARLRQDQKFLLVTQNVDGLHQRAGSRNVVELHGNLGLTRCSNDACDLEPFADEEAHAGHVPACPRCSSCLRPHIVLFGEPIPIDAAWTVKLALRNCDLFIAIGTSGLVAPAANFVRSAEYAGARTVYVNLEPMNPPDRAFQEVYLGKAEEILPELLDSAD
ncbi:MAG TPA: NAD-dependent deacylase [Thermoanaerobaculia bacterium]|nr:NAD-dependent deacylase [Thermoanaerobaculia bacterium]